MNIFESSVCSVCVITVVLLCFFFLYQRLRDCNLSERSCYYLSSVLSSPSCSLTGLDLRQNNLGLSGKKLCENSTKTTVRTDNVSLKDMISRSVLIRSGPPAVYQLRAKKQKFGTLTRMTVGEKNQDKPNKTILLVGETGEGKSTLINALVNYTMGVKWEDKVWFQIVEEEGRSQTETQTSDVIIYEILGFKDETLPYSLTIIDTPGYRNTRGFKHDDIISERLLYLFRSEDGVHEVSAVGLVMKATNNRPCDRLMYVFNSVMSLFGMDVQKNIIALITHSDGRKPKSVLQTLRVANFKCAKNERDEPVHFLFDNCQDEEQTEENEYLKLSWELTQRNVNHFTDFLGKSNPQKLMKTVDVLNEQIRLKASIQNLQDRIMLAELKKTEIRQIRESLKKQGNYRNKTESENKLSLLENLEKIMIRLTAEKSQILDESYQHAVKLKEIALNVDSVCIVHLDFLIGKMKEKGDTEKVQKLEEMRWRVDERTQAACRYKCCDVSVWKRCVQFDS